MKSLNVIRSINSNLFSENFLTSDMICNKNDVSNYIYHLLRVKNIQNCSEVYKNAGISKQNWSNYVSGKTIPTLVNVRKLVVGLRCTIEEAETFLSLCGFQFVKNSKVDECIKSCLQKKIFKMIDVELELSTILAKKVA